MARGPMCATVGTDARLLMPRSQAKSGGDDQEQALTRARVKIDEIEAEAQSDR